MIVISQLLLLAHVVGAETQAVSISIRGKNQGLALYGSRGNPPVILASGDLGWAGFVTAVAEFLQSKGYFVIGFNSKAYLSSFTDKKSAVNSSDVPQDYRVLVAYARQTTSERPILAGVSEGAGLSVLAATDARLKNEVKGVLGLGLPDQIELGWRWQDFAIWITKKNPDEPHFMVSDYIGKVTPVPLAEIHSTNDEFLRLDLAQKMFSKGGEPKRMWVVEAANHRFSNNRDGLNKVLLEALEWIKSQKK